MNQLQLCLCCSLAPSHSRSFTNANCLSKLFLERYYSTAGETEEQLLLLDPATTSLVSDGGESAVKACFRQPPASFPFKRASEVVVALQQWAILLAGAFPKPETQFTCQLGLFVIGPQVCCICRLVCNCFQQVLVIIF